MIYKDIFLLVRGYKYVMGGGGSLVWPKDPKLVITKKEKKIRELKKYIFFFNSGELFFFFFINDFDFLDFFDYLQQSMLLDLNITRLVLIKEYTYKNKIYIKEIFLSNNVHARS